MKRVFTIMLFIVIALGSYAGDKVKGELRTEINGFQWYCNKNKEAYTIDGTKLFDFLDKVISINFSVVDQDDEGVFIVKYKKKRDIYIGAFNSKGKEIKSYFPLFYNLTSMDSYAITFENPNRKEYYIRYHKVGENSKYSANRDSYYFLINRHNGKEYDEYNSYEIKNNYIIYKRNPDNGKPYMSVERYDGKQICDYFSNITYQNGTKIFICQKQNKEKTIIDSIGNILVDNIIEIQKKNSFYEIVSKSGKGLMSLSGKLIVSPEKGYSEYNVMKVNGQTYYCIKNNQSNYILFSAVGKNVLGREYEYIENVGNNYVKVKSGTCCGIMNLDGKEIIPISRGYTYISDYDSSKGTFAFTKKGFSGVCDAQGREIATTRLAPTSDDIKTNGGYASVVEMKNGSTKYYKVSKNGRYGLTDNEGRAVIACEMEALESAGTDYLRYKLNGFWGLMNYQGKILIDTDRGYTSIGDFKSFNKRFAYTMNGYKGECDATGRQISKIKVDTPRSNSSVASSSGSSSSSSSTSSSSNNNNSGGGTTTVVVEHQYTPQPVQQWQACWACGGMGTMGCDFCGGSGTKYIGDRLDICSRCRGKREIPCNICFGNKGQYITVYR